jgi:hypothetical protein
MGGGLFNWQKINRFNLSGGAGMTKLGERNPLDQPYSRVTDLLVEHWLPPTYWNMAGLCYEAHHVCS